MKLASQNHKAEGKFVLTHMGTGVITIYITPVYCDESYKIASVIIYKLIVLKAPYRCTDQSVPNY